jgi:PTH1 family peptidyl-tRNA hydrolase
MMQSDNGPESFVIAGLGNPGKKYELTRHNIGLMVIEEVAKKWNWQLKEEKDFGAWIAKGEQNGAKVHLLFPAMFMNNSGFVVRRYLDYYHLSAKHLIVVSDEVALPFGMMRLRETGSSGGHNGLKNIENCLQTKDYIRLRMGIGCPLQNKTA